MFDGKAFAVEVVDIVKGFITKALHDIKIDIAGLIERVDDLELREPVNGTNGKDADPALIERMVVEEVSKLPKPKDGVNGKDIDPQIVAKMVADAVAAIPQPKDGTNGTSITVDDVAPIIALEVADAVSKIPVAKDGIGLCGAFIDRSNELIITLSDGSTRELGVVVGTNGKDGVNGDKGEDGLNGINGLDADVNVIREMVLREVAQLPKPIDGKDAPPIDPDKIRVAVEDYFKWSPVQHGVNGTNGKDADPAVIERMVTEAVSKLPKAKDGTNGKDVDPLIVERMIADAVSKLPAPKDGENGKDADPEEIAELVNKAVTTAIAALPKAKEPIGFSSSLIDKNGSLIITRTDGMVCEIGRIVGKDGVNGENGKDADPAIIERMIEDRISIALEDMDNKPQIDLTIPDDLVDEISKAAAFLAESPTVSQRTGSRVTRTIRTRRDENGYLVGDVIERGLS